MFIYRKDAKKRIITGTGKVSIIDRLNDKKRIIRPLLEQGKIDVMDVLDDRKRLSRPLSEPNVRRFSDMVSWKNKLRFRSLGKNESATIVSVQLVEDTTFNIQY